MGLHSHAVSRHGGKRHVRQKRDKQAIRIDFDTCETERLLLSGAVPEAAALWLTEDKGVRR